MPFRRLGVVATLAVTVATSMAGAIVAADPAMADLISLTTGRTDTGCEGFINLNDPHWGYGTVRAGDSTCGATLYETNIRTGGRTWVGADAYPGQLASTVSEYYGDGVHQLQVCVFDQRETACTAVFGYRP